MASPAIMHRMRVLAQREAEAGAAGLPPMPGSAQALMLVKLQDDRRTLKAIESVERKIAAKHGMLHGYTDYIDGVLAADSAAADEVLTTVMVWYLDVGDYARGLDIAAHMLKHGLELPERYNRKVPALLLDEVSDAVLNEHVPHTDATLMVLQRVAALTHDRDAPDQARAKLHRAMGEVMATLAGPEPQGPAVDAARAALAQLQRAVKLHEKVGAKKTIEQLQRIINRAEKPPA